MPLRVAACLAHSLSTTVVAGSVERRRGRSYGLACLRSRDRAQTPLNPRNIKKLRRKYKIAHPGLGPENTKKLRKWAKIGQFWPIFVFFSYFRGPSRGGRFCIFFVTFLYFWDSGVFGLCPSSASTQLWPPPHAIRQRLGTHPCLRTFSGHYLHDWEADCCTPQVLGALVQWEVLPFFSETKKLPVPVLKGKNVAKI